MSQGLTTADLGTSTKGHHMSRHGGEVLLRNSGAFDPTFRREGVGGGEDSCVSVH